MNKDTNSRSQYLEGQSLEGQFLIAMPSIGDDRFCRSLIYMCAHTDDGAMGLVINQKADELSYPSLLSKLELFSQLDVAGQDQNISSLPVHIGGPVATTRGFVLHTNDYFHKDSTLTVSDDICLTSSIDIIQAIADGQGPVRSITAIGYSGWGPGQLDFEIKKNGWLTCPADHEIIFEKNIANKYDHALSNMGVDLAFLAHDHGHA